ncbi:cytochrome c-type biogenesis protein CcmH [Cognatiyoonia koreensis]|uniref:Cytochrome c-type biogenesis protein CcmH n=1 Tax=Cognatiyoonia koreensis TaxID=364200 RepID=A0A1I0NM48_9RHOB|nr:c-type cytochrome biogenesis protein CcmI [Cognatiyoonia koreensis]SEW02599.1 cytochrome c-type biogenesis protein CcmH [Cognatiyoonia koreensis]
MLFWITCVVMTLLVGSYVALPLLRQRRDTEQAPDVAIYKAQLAEIDKDVARDLLEPDEAERARLEVSRRLLAASKASHETGHASAGTNKFLALVIVAGLGAVGIGVYWVIGAPGEPDQPLAQRHAIAAEMRENRPSQTELAAAAPEPPQVEASDAYLESIAQLRAIVPTRPDDLQGWELLAFHETQLRNYSAAVAAQERVIALRGDDLAVADLILLTDLMVAAADGIVSPEAEVIARQIVDLDPGSVAGRYYIGSMHNQNARPDIAFRLWRPLVESGEDSFHIALARAQIENAAARAGVDYTAPASVGPDLAQIAAAEDMTEEERQAMVGNMVAGLADRLATQGGPPSDWARLITAYGVLGDTENAGLIWLEAQQVFGSNEEAMDVLRAAAVSAGVAE